MTDPMLTVRADFVAQAVGANYGSITNITTVARRVARHEVDRETVATTLRLYVDHRGLATADRELRNHNLAVLSGPRDAGLWSAAIVLLHRIGNLDLEALLLEEEDPRSELHVDSRRGYLVDLRGPGDSVPPWLSRRLLSHADQLSALGSYLVVLVEPGRWEHTGSQLVPTLLGSPEPAEVVRSHLELASASESDADWWLDQDKIRQLLPGMNPGDAARLARLITEVAGTPAARLGTADRAELVSSAYRNWTERLDAWVSVHPEARDRCTLVAVATLEGEPAGTVLAAADALAESVRLPAQPGWPLTGEPSAKRIERLEATTTTDGVRFRLPTYGPSVLDFAWGAWPQFRPILGTWLTELAVRRDVYSPTIGQRVAATVADLAVRHEDAGFLHMVAGPWARNSATRGLAVAILGEGALSPGIGRAVRRTLYRWAQNATTDDALVEVVAEVSVRVSARYPNVAMTRLRHVATHPGAGVRAASEGLRAVVAETPALFARALREAADWRAGDNPVRRTAGAEAFLRLVSGEQWDHSLESPSRGGLADGWRAVLAAPLGELAVSAARGWLDLAAAGPERRADLLGVLAAGTDQSSTAGMRLVGLAEDWAREVPEQAEDRAAVRDELLRKVLDNDPAVRAMRWRPDGEAYHDVR